MNEANMTPRQKIMVDVFQIFADSGLEANTATQLLLIDKITTYVMDQREDATEIECSKHNAVALERIERHRDQITEARLASEDAAVDYLQARHENE